MFGCNRRKKEIVYEALSLKKVKIQYNDIMGSYNFVVYDYQVTSTFLILHMSDSSIKYTKLDAIKSFDIMGFKEEEENASDC